MKILAIADEESPALWDHYSPGKLDGYDLILACGDLKAAYLTFLVTMSHARLLYIPGNHDGTYEEKPPEGCECIDDQLVVYNGIRILGLGGCLRHTLCQHLFQHLLIQTGIHGTLHSPAHSIGDGVANRTRDGIAEIDGAVGTQPLIRAEES